MNKTKYESRKIKFPSSKFNFKITDGVTDIGGVILILIIFIVTYWLISTVADTHVFWPLEYTLKAMLWVTELPRILGISICFTILFVLFFLSEKVDKTNE